MDLAEARPAWGCPQLHRQLRQEGHVINHRRRRRLYREQALTLRRRRRRHPVERESSFVDIQLRGHLKSSQHPAQYNCSLWSSQHTPVLGPSRTAQVR
ncbi:IS3 family transposase [Tahibacter soli]|uniref:IS3 family transposase n=1 Tax=Tahibacter soli TaxID=2983605 RepID=UPI003CCDB4F4